MIGICTITSDEIADRDKERRNCSVRVLSRICGTSYGAIGTTPAGVCTSQVFAFMHCNNQFFGSLIRIKVRLLQPHTYMEDAPTAERKGSDGGRFPSENFRSFLPFGLLLGTTKGGLLMQQTRPAQRVAPITICERVC